MNWDNDDLDFTNPIKLNSQLWGRFLQFVVDVYVHVFLAFIIFGMFSMFFIPFFYKQYKKLIPTDKLSEDGVKSACNKAKRQITFICFIWTIIAWSFFIFFQTHSSV